MQRLLLAALSLAFLPACLSGPKAPTPHYQNSKVKIFKTSGDYTHKKGAYIFGGLRLEGLPSEAVDARFSLIMEYGRDLNTDGVLNSNEILDTDRIQDGSLPFYYNIEEITVQPGSGRAMCNIRMEFAGEEPFRFNRQEPGLIPN